MTTFDTFWLRSQCSNHHFSLTSSPLTVSWLHFGFVLCCRKNILRGFALVSFWPHFGRFFFIIVHTLISWGQKLEETRETTIHGNIWTATLLKSSSLLTLISWSWGLRPEAWGHYVWCKVEGNTRSMTLVWCLPAPQSSPAFVSCKSYRQELPTDLFYTILACCLLHTRRSVLA